MPKWARKWGPFFSEIRYRAVWKRLETASDRQNLKKTWFRKGTRFRGNLGTKFNWIFRKNDVLTDAPRATWHYYSNVFGVCRCLGQISYGNRFGAHFGAHFGTHLDPQIRLFFDRGRPKRIPDRTEKAWTAIGRRSRIGSKNGAKKIGRKSKTGQPPILRGGVQRPREGIKGWVNPFL